jgi:hypothetical protein
MIECAALTAIVFETIAGAATAGTGPSALVMPLTARMKS